MSDAAEVNRRHWDSLAQVHGEGSDAYYDIDALAAGRDTLSAVELAAVECAVGDVAGKDVLHVQCHLGLDSVSLARRGARVTGVDFSSASLEKAAAIARRCEVDVDFVEGDSTALPASLHGRFDLAYATIGILGWIGDIDAWMRSAHAVLRPGGALVLVDIHPLFSMVAGTEPLVADFPYAFSGAIEFDEQGSYADAEAVLASSRSVEFAHSVGEIVTAAVDAGLQVRRLAEHLEVEYDPRGRLLTREDDGLFRLRIGGLPVPVLYTLVASRAAAV